MERHFIKDGGAERKGFSKRKPQPFRIAPLHVKESDGAAQRRRSLSALAAITTGEGPIELDGARKTVRQPATTSGVSSLISVLDEAVRCADTRRTSSDLATTSTPGVELASSVPASGTAFASVAQHLARFNARNTAEDVSKYCTSLISGALEQLQPGQAITGRLTAVALTVLKQLFGLVLRVDPYLKDLCATTQTLLELSLFANYAYAPPAEDGPGKPSFTFIGRLIDEGANEADINDALQHDCAETERRFIPYYTATANIGAKAEVLQNRLHHAVTVSNHRMKGIVLLQEIQRKRILGKALTGWKLQVRHDRMMRKLTSANLTFEEKLKNALKDVDKLHRELAHEKESKQAQTQLLANDLHATRKGYDSMVEVVARYRKSTDDFRDEQARVMQQELEALEGIIESYRLELTDLGSIALMEPLSHSDSLFEHYSRDLASKSFLSFDRLLSLISGKAVTGSSPTTTSALEQTVPAQQLVEEWAKSMTSMLPCGNRCVFSLSLSSESAQTNLGASLLALLHRMSPGHVPYNQVEKCFIARTKFQWEATQSYLNTMGLHSLAASIDSLADPPGWVNPKSLSEDLTSLLMGLLARFAGVDPGPVQFLPPSTVSDEFRTVWSKSMPGFPEGITMPQIPPASANPEEYEAMIKFIKGRLAARRTMQTKWASVHAAIRQRFSSETFSALRSALYSHEIAERLPPIPPLERRRAQALRVLPKKIAEHSALKDDARSRLRLETEVLGIYSCHLRRAFTFYSVNMKSGDKDSRMSLEEFLSVLSDAKLTPDPVSIATATKVFQQSATLPGTGGSAIKEKESLGPTEFVEALLRVAIGLDDDLLGAECEPGVVGRAQYVIVDHVIKQANGSATIDFKRQFYLPQVQQIVKGYEQVLARIYAHYAADDGTPTGPNDMSEKEFLRCCSDLKLVDSVCTHLALQQLYYKVPDGSRDDGTFQNLTLQDFTEVIGAIALFKNPTPQLSLQYKVRRFYESYLVNFNPPNKR
jgi:hypothetical protein